ncbi:exodeoxyribonuclease VII large subunit [Rhodoferax koreense]|uniref:Exodeoxyribonuclease 7 large subunit n=1 Tax=Rhodoferax koreensis TaxID=1842727 RepID=A0A1P8K418_9BURK|nr:exodeoxyribonuclease VII large subunit [Rhodoferax koreense]APW40736.1 exodeoxyribonuclease VII large subunit [Rhodoferax koreense]
MCGRPALIENPASAPLVWPVGALCRAIADALEARFNPVAVRGEISGFSRASSGHCYFNIKDAQGQIRCAMFRRAASLLGFVPRDGELVEVRGRLDIYGPRGDLQLIVESLQRAGQGALFEQFLRLKAKLESEGLFDAARKRGLPVLPRGIGVVTSLGAAALHDVVTALRRRVPHIPVVVSPALVQGAGAPADLVRALLNLYHLAQDGSAREADPTIDVILLVRGGGSIEDLWAFNDEAVARLIAQSPVPVVSGVGHETDFTIADFVADLRAPTPTAAAELVAEPRDVWLGALALAGERLADAVTRQLDARGQRLDLAASRLGRPSGWLARQQAHLGQQQQRLRYETLAQLERHHNRWRLREAEFPARLQQALTRSRERLDRAERSLALLDPRLVLQRGYALLSTAEGRPLSSVAQATPGQPVRADLADGELALTVQTVRPG